MKHLLKNACLCCLCLAIAFAQTLSAASLHPPIGLVILNTVSGANEFSPALEFTKVDYQSAVAMQLVLPNGQSFSVPRGQIALVFQYPDPTSTLSGTPDTQHLTAKRAEAVALEARFPKAKTALDRVIAEIDVDLQKLAAGQVRYSGVWQTPGASSTQTGIHEDLATVAVKGITYHHVTITRLDNGSVGLSHEGGILRVPLTEATPELLRAIRAKADLFRGINRVADLTLETGKLTGVMLVAVQGDDFILLHDGGVLRIPREKLTEAQQQLLSANHPAPRSSPSPDSVPVSKEANKLVFGDGIGKRNLELGWRCPAEEMERWQAAAKEAFNTDPEELATFWKLQFGAIPREPGEVVLKTPIPEYNDTIAFLNSKLPYRVGYNQTSHCLVFLRTGNNANSIQAAIQADKVNADVHFDTEGTHGSVRLEGLNGAKAFSLYHHVTSGKETVLWRDSTSEIRIRVASPEDAPRVAKALMYLLVMLGARNGSF